MSVNKFDGVLKSSDRRGCSQVEITALRSGMSVAAAPEVEKRLALARLVVSVLIFAWLGHV